jgi:hypothetical protein
MSPVISYKVAVLCLTLNGKVKALLVMLLERIHITVQLFDSKG